MSIKKESATVPKQEMAAKNIWIILFELILVGKVPDQHRFAKKCTQYPFEEINVKNDPEPFHNKFLRAIFSWEGVGRKKANLRLHQISSERVIAKQNLGAAAVREKDTLSFCENDAIK